MDAAQNLPICGACGRAVAPGKACVAFRAYHARCIEKAVDLERLAS
jgi:hypothetical protein